jgi:hypothetical protein
MTSCQPNSDFQPVRGVRQAAGGRGVVYRVIGRPLRAGQLEDSPCLEARGKVC